MAPVRWIVDASNVIGSRPDGWWHDRDRAARRLADDVTAWAAVTGSSVTLVLDRPVAGLEPGLHDGVTVAVARWRGRDAADHEIVWIVEEDAEPGTLRVVTSDRRLRERVEALGGRVVSSLRFRTDLDRS
ncbi:MAG TPA: NYN domain-containing protein [Actinomycetota bacterium]|nr:NYN domain-containing protein [Actinomycetota bacterium]